MIDLLWLLLPVAAASGWVTARLKKRQKSLSNDYFKGLNYLLNEEADKAIDVFIKLIDVDSETVETHLALAVFFRRHGEINRAIRIHHNLITMSNLSLEQRHIALFELGLDYRQAGLLDRAENFFQELIYSETHNVLALQQLLEIHQQVQDWDNAIITAQKLAHANNEPMNIEIAHYYCEQADKFRQKKEFNAAQQAIEWALKIDPNSVRASLLAGQVALETDDPKTAIIAFERVEQQDANYLSQIIEPLQICYQKIGQPETFTHYLYHLLDNYSSIKSVLMLADLINQAEGDNKKTADFLITNLKKSPSILGIDYLLDLYKPEGFDKDLILLLKKMTQQLLKDKYAYQCNSCGFTVRKLYWQCPSCKRWSSLNPIGGIEAE
jgi:lipopolysaccharide biosynthesis regulator YciM